MCVWGGVGEGGQGQRRKGRGRGEEKVGRGAARAAHTLTARAEVVSSKRTPRPLQHHFIKFGTRKDTAQDVSMTKWLLPAPEAVSVLLFIDELISGRGKCQVESVNLFQSKENEAAGTFEVQSRPSPKYTTSMGIQKVGQ